MDRFSKIEDNNLAQLLNNVKEVARFTGYAFHSPFMVRVMGAGGEFGTPWEECNSLFQETYVISANSFDESPKVVAYTLPLACDWQFSRWLEFPPRSEGGEAPITLEFIKRSPGKKEKLVWLKINPYQAELLEKSKKGTDTYPPNIGYSSLEWLWKDKIAEVVEELSSLRQDASKPHLFEADVNRVRLVKDGTSQDGGNAKEVISISVVENNSGHDATSFYVDCPNNGDWAFGEWTLTGKESIEAGYLGFSLVERNSKRVRHILCNPWTAFEIGRAHV